MSNLSNENTPPTGSGNNEYVVLLAACSIPLEGLSQIFPSTAEILPLTGTGLGQFGFLVGVGIALSVFLDLRKKWKGRF